MLDLFDTVVLRANPKPMHAPKELWLIVSIPRSSWYTPVVFSYDLSEDAKVSGQQQTNRAVVIR